MAKKKGIKKIPHGYGSITKLSGNRAKPYIARLPRQEIEIGVVSRPILGTYKEYKEAYDALMKYHIDPYKIEQKEITFQEGYNLWWDSLDKVIDEKKKISDSSRSIYKSIFTNHCNKIKQKKMVDITKWEIIDLINECEKGFDTKRYIKMLISQVFKFVIELDGAVKKNPATGIKLGSKPKSNKHLPFENKEIDLLWKNIEIPFVKHILICIYTGLRPGELLLLHKDKVFLEQNYMIAGFKTEAGTDRTIPIHPRIKNFIQELYDNTNNYLIYNTKNKVMRYEYFSDKFQEVMNQLHLEHLPHDTRHTFATLADYYNMNHVCKKLILGHAQADITDGVYTHKNIDMLFEAICLLP